MQQSDTSSSEELSVSGKEPKKTRRLKGPWTRSHGVSACSSSVRWIVGLECDGKGQVPAGSERGQHPQHFTLHILDSVSVAASCPLLSAL